MIGRVVSAKMDKSVTVLVSRVAKHPLYKKTFLQSKKYLVDTKGDIKEGDIVEIVKIKPISKNKHWRVVKVVGQDLAEIMEARQKKAAEEIIAEVMPEEKEEAGALRAMPVQKESKDSKEPEVKEKKKGKK